MLVYLSFNATVNQLIVCSTNKLILELSSNRCEPDWFLSLNFFYRDLVRKDFFLLKIN